MLKRAAPELIGIGSGSKIPRTDICDTVEIKEEFIEEDDSSIEVIPNESSADSTEKISPTQVIPILTQQQEKDKAVVDQPVKEEFIAIEEVLEVIAAQQPKPIVSQTNCQKDNSREKVCEICGDRFYNVGGLYMHHSMKHLKDPTIPLKFKDCLFSLNTYNLELYILFVNYISVICVTKCFQPHIFLQIIMIVTVTHLAVQFVAMDSVIHEV